MRGDLDAEPCRLTMIGMKGKCETMSGEYLLHENKTESLSILLGCRERRKETVTDLSGYARARVFDIEYQIHLWEMEVDTDLAVMSDCFNRISKDIQHGLLDLTPINSYPQRWSVVVNHNTNVA